MVIDNLHGILLEEVDESELLFGEDEVLFVCVHGEDLSLIV